jgi:hypothetical protein
MNWKRGEHCIYRPGNFANSLIYAISEIIRLRACHNQCTLVPEFPEWVSMSWPNLYAISAFHAISEVLQTFHNFAISVVYANSDVLVIFLASLVPCL